MGIKIQSNNNQIKIQMKSIYKSNSTQCLASLMIVCLMGMSLATGLKDLRSELGQWINIKNDQKPKTHGSRMLFAGMGGMGLSGDKTHEVSTLEWQLHALYFDQYNKELEQRKNRYYLNMYNKCVEVYPANGTCTWNQTYYTNAVEKNYQDQEDIRRQIDETRNSLNALLTASQVEEQDRVVDGWKSSLGFYNNLLLGNYLREELTKFTNINNATTMHCDY